MEFQPGVTVKKWERNLLEAVGLNPRVSIVDLLSFFLLFLLNSLGTSVTARVVQYSNIDYIFFFLVFQYVEHVTGAMCQKAFGTNVYRWKQPMC